MVVIRKSAKNDEFDKTENKEAVPERKQEKWCLDTMKNLHMHQLDDKQMCEYYFFTPVHLPW